MSAILRNLGALSSLMLALVGAVLALLSAFGVHLTPDQSSAILGVFSAVLAVVAGITATTTTPNGDVVESTPDGFHVIAGQANELPTGKLVRDNLGAH